MFSIAFYILLAVTTAALLMAMFRTQSNVAPRWATVRVIVKRIRR